MVEDTTPVTSADLTFYTIDVLGWNPKSGDPPPKLAIAWAHTQRQRELEKEAIQAKRLAARGAFVSAIGVALATLVLTNLPWGLIWAFFSKLSP